MSDDDDDDYDDYDDDIDIYNAYNKDNADNVNDDGEGKVLQKQTSLKILNYLFQGRSCHQRFSNATCGSMGLLKLLVN